MSSPTAAESPSMDGAHLKRSLGFGDLVAFGLAYIAIVAPLTSLGFVWAASDGLIASSFLVAAICMYFTALSYVTMSRAIPNAGSVYGFARRSLGHRLGFLAGWLILMDYLLVPALVFTLMAIGMALLAPALGLAGWICVVALITLGLNWCGIGTTSKINAFSVAMQCVIVTVVLVLTIMALNGGAGNGALTAQPFVGDRGIHWPHVFSGASIAVMAFLGFDAISTLSEETRDSSDQGLIGRAILTVLAVTSVLFVFIAWAVGNLMPAIEMQDPGAAIFELLGQTVGPWASITLAWALAVVVGFTNTLPMVAGVSRVLFAMGRDRQLPATLGRVHGASGVPRVALVTATLVPMVTALVLRDRVEVLASMVSLGALGGFIMLHISVMVYFRHSDQRSVYFHIVAPALGLMVALAVLLRMHPSALKMGAVWLTMGMVYSAWLNRRARRDQDGQRPKEQG
ncbi:hypothetical protein B0E41_08890 [Hydrogenophaga sp. A37]|nr:hypothetical protein B0E41_08890 [Hydrogenophaga sp. A37]